MPSTSRYGIVKLTRRGRDDPSIDQLCLVADVFDLQAVAPDAAGLSAAACAALSALYRHASQELRATLPAALLNWEGVAARLRAHGRPLPVGSDAGSPEDITTTWFVDVDRVSEVDRSEAPRCR